MSSQKLSIFARPKTLLEKFPFDVSRKEKSRQFQVLKRGQIAKKEFLDGQNTGKLRKMERNSQVLLSNIDILFCFGPILGEFLLIFVLNKKYRRSKIKLYRVQ